MPKGDVLNCSQLGVSFYAAYRKASEKQYINAKHKWQLNRIQ